MVCTEYEGVAGIYIYVLFALMKEEIFRRAAVGDGYDGGSGTVPGGNSPSMSWRSFRYTSGKP